MVERVEGLGLKAHVLIRGRTNRRGRHRRRARRAEGNAGKRAGRGRGAADPGAVQESPVVK